MTGAALLGPGLRVPAVLAHIGGPEGSPWAFRPHADIIALAVVLVGAYLYALRRFGPLFHPGAGERAASPLQKTAFVLGALSLYAALGWPVHDLGEHSMYSFHMVQHLVLGFVTPPLLLLGTPEWLARMVLGRGALRRAYTRLTRPIPAAIIFNVTLALIHWPKIVDLMLASEAFHALIHVVFLAGAMLMWSVLYSPLPEVARLSPPARIGFLFLQSLIPTVPASFLTFGDRPLYRAYEALPQLWGLSPLDDMQLAGLIMKVGGGLFLWAIIAGTFFRWVAREDELAVGVPAPAAAPADGLPPNDSSTLWS